MSTLISTPGREPTESEALRLRVEGLEAQVRELSRSTRAGSGVALIFLDYRIDRLLAGMSIATGAAAMGEPAHLFFAFGATAALRRKRELGMDGLDQPLQMARELGVKIYVCETSMQLLGFGMDDLMDYPGLEACGVATFLSHALESRVSLSL